MFVSTINFLLETKNVFMYRLPEPYIETQPKMFIPRYSIKESLSVDDSVLKDRNSLKNMPGKTSFSLGFSVNFEDTNEQPRFNISCLYSISEIKIKLKRFCKKIQNRKDVTRSSEPLNIILPNDKIEILTFCFFISKTLLKEGLFDLKNNTLSFWLSTCYNDPIVDEIRLREAITKFKNLLHIRPSDDPQQFAFQFCVEIPISSMFVNVEVKSKLIYTHVFEFIFDDINLNVKLNEVDPMDYCLE